MSRAPKRSGEPGGGKAMIARTQNQSNNRGQYKTFNDVERAGYEGGWYYAGNGKEQEDFFKKYSNFDELINGMSAGERSAWDDYWVPGHFMSGQQYRGWDNMSATDQRLTKIYDKILDKSELRRGVIVTRRTDAQLLFGAGKKTATLAELKAMEGQIVDSNGNMSFGAAKHGLTIGDSSKSIEYRLSIPGGTKGAGMWIGDKRINSDFGNQQREFMTNRNISVKVGKTVYDADRGVYVVELKYVGRLAHDYGKRGKK